MLKRGRGWALMLSIVALAGALAPAASQQLDANKALAQEQVKLARQALQDLDLMNKREQVALWDPKFALWERRQVEAIRAAGATHAEFVEALEAYRKRLQQLERFVEQGFQKGELSRLDLHDAKYRVLEAEMWLNQEKAR
jgi:outer membrane protein TolC